MKESKTWWGQRFIDALCQFTDSRRLARGKAYNSDRRILDWEIKAGKVKARIRGNTNPYFGVTREPRYTSTLSLSRIPANQWKQIIHNMSQKASTISRLMLDEMPENIETIFKAEGLSLLPVDSRDFKVKCSCPDYSSSCKHIAGVCYRLAAILDHDPLLLFELRGLSAEKLKKELLKYPLGEALAALIEEESIPAIHDSYYTRPVVVDLPDQISENDFWYGQQSFPKQTDPVTPASISGLPIKKAGDYPEFWHKNVPFTEVMAEFYDRVRKGSKL